MTVYGYIFISFISVSGILSPCHLEIYSCGGTGRGGVRNPGDLKKIPRGTFVTSEITSVSETLDVVVVFSTFLEGAKMTRQTRNLYSIYINFRI